MHTKEEHATLTSSIGQKELAERDRRLDHAERALMMQQPKIVGCLRWSEPGVAA